METTPISRLRNSTLFIYRSGELNFYRTIRTEEQRCKQYYEDPLDTMYIQHLLRTYDEHHA